MFVLAFPTPQSHRGKKWYLIFWSSAVSCLKIYNYLDRVLWGEVFLDWVQQFGPTPGVHTRSFTKKKKKKKTEKTQTCPAVKPDQNRATDSKTSSNMKCFQLKCTKEHPFTVTIVSIRNKCNFIATNSKIGSPVFTSEINNEMSEGRSTVLQRPVIMWLPEVCGYQILIITCNIFAFIHNYSCPTQNSGSLKSAISYSHKL